jgi:hypothetical protein
MMEEQATVEGLQPPRAFLARYHCGVVNRLDCASCYVDDIEMYV